MSERTRLEEIRERADFDDKVLGPAEMLDQSDHDHRWLRERVDELERALRSTAHITALCWCWETLPNCTTVECVEARAALAALHAKETDRG